jgi:RNA polymerase sigma factor (sigma-70 family)
LFHSVSYDKDIAQIKGEEDQILELLSRLPPTQRLVMTCHLDGFDNKEIANQLGMLEATVRSTLRHAREKMKKAFPGQQCAATDEEGTG